MKIAPLIRIEVVAFLLIIVEVNGSFVLKSEKNLAMTVLGSSAKSQLAR